MMVDQKNSTNKNIIDGEEELDIGEKVIESVFGVRRRPPTRNKAFIMLLGFSVIIVLFFLANRHNIVLMKKQSRYDAQKKYNECRETGAKDERDGCSYFCIETKEGVENVYIDPASISKNSCLDERNKYYY